MAEQPRSNTRASSASILIGGILCLGLLAGGCAMGNQDDQESQARINGVLAAAGLQPVDHPSAAPVCGLPQAPAVPYVDPTTQTNIAIEILRARQKQFEEIQRTNQEIAAANQRMADAYGRTLSGEHCLGYVEVVPGR